MQKAVLHAQQRQPQQLNGSFSETFGGLASLLAEPEAAAPRGAAMRSKTTWMLVCHILAITKLVRLGKRPLLLASTAAHQRPAQDSVVHQNIRGLEIYTVGCTCAAPRACVTFTGASTPSETLTGQKKDTSGDDTPAGPQRGPRRWPFGPRELLRDPLRVTRRARHNSLHPRRSGRTFESSVVVVASSA